MAGHKTPRRPPAQLDLQDDDEYVDAPEGGEDGDDAAEEEAPPPAKAGKNGKAKKKTAVETVDPDDVPFLTAKFGLEPEDVKKKKMTRKQQAYLERYKGVQRSKSIDAMFAGIAADKRKKFGHQAVFMGKDTQKLVIGIPVPALAFEFLIGQNCFPLGLIFQLVAETGLGKSALLAEFGRWFDLAGGGMELFENETKFNDKWYRSIMGDELFERKTPLNRCKSVEDWQRMLTFTTQAWKSRMIGTAEEPGPGRTFPVLFGIDSIMGKLSEASTEKIMGAAAKNGMRGKTGEGHASRGYPEEALVITRYLKSYPSEIDHWPFSLVLINHLKMGRDDNGNDVRNKAGGKQVDFQESFEIELSKVGGPKKMIRCSAFEGYPIALTCFKNSFSPGQRRIHTRLLWSWTKDEETGAPKQETIWDWDWSTIWLLNNILHGEKADPMLRASLKEDGFHLDCPQASDVENLAWSKDLGMSRDDAASWAEVGAMIRRNRKLMKRLRVALRIDHRPILEGDYLEQLSDAAADLV